MTTTALRSMQDFWANTPAGANPSEWDEEVQVVNAIQPKSVPPWAWQVLSDLPAWGFEFCNQNWLSGLDECVAAIGIRELRPRSFGSCGNMHPAMRVTLEEWYYGLRCWLSGISLSAAQERMQRQGQARDPDMTETLARIYSALRTENEQHKRAASIFAEVLALALREMPAKSGVPSIANLRAFYVLENDSPFFKLFLEKLAVLERSCNFHILDDLHGLLNGIAYPEHAEAYFQNVLICNDSLRSLFTIDPGRVEGTLAYLLGVTSWLYDWPEGQMDALQPHRAMLANRVPARLRTQDPVSRWLAAAFIKAVKLWLTRAFSIAQSMPLRDLERQRLRRAELIMERVKLESSELVRPSWADAM
jgi:hypothetical protein